MQESLCSKCLSLSACLRECFLLVYTENLDDDLAHTVGFLKLETPTSLPNHFCCHKVNIDHRNGICAMEKDDSKES